MVLVLPLNFPFISNSVVQFYSSNSNYNKDSGLFIHSISGCTDYFARDEDEAFVICRDIVHSLNMKTTTSDNNSQFTEPSPTLPWQSK